jgi:3-oxoacyl-ACP reductase-like protein
MKDFWKGERTEVPPRDPLTMKPMDAPAPADAPRPAPPSPAAPGGAGLR